MLVFNREQAQKCFVEAIPLLIKHGRELKYHRDLQLDPEFSRYEQLEKTGFLRAYTARIDGALVGYSVFFLSPHLHFRKNQFAVCDILFIDPLHRGFGLSFIRWCNHQLKMDGAHSIDYYVNVEFDYSIILKRLGFRRSAELYSKGTA